MVVIEENINKLNLLANILGKNGESKRIEKSRYLHLLAEIVGSFESNGGGGSAPHRLMPFVGPNALAS